MSITDWVANKLAENPHITVIGRTPEGFLEIGREDGPPFLVAVLGVQGQINLSDVQPLFANTTKPHMVINVPSSTLWSGAAIRYIHAENAAFGRLGDISRAGSLADVGTYRDKNMGFFIDAIRQHTNVTRVSYVFDTVLKVDRAIGPSVNVAVIEAYNMSAEDVRNARNRLGQFDIVVKSTGYGSITPQAEAAATSMGAQALTFGQLMGRLRQ